MQMKLSRAENRLPKKIIEKAVLAANEFGWK